MAIGEANSIERRTTCDKPQSVPFSVATNGTSKAAPNTETGHRRGQGGGSRLAGGVEGRPGRFPTGDQGSFRELPAGSRRSDRGTAPRDRWPDGRLATGDARIQVDDGDRSSSTVHRRWYSAIGIDTVSVMGHSLRDPPRLATLIKCPRSRGKLSRACRRGLPCLGWVSSHKLPQQLVVAGGCDRNREDQSDYLAQKESKVKRLAETSKLRERCEERAKSESRRKTQNQHYSAREHGQSEQPPSVRGSKVPTAAEACPDRQILQNHRGEGDEPPQQHPHGEC